LEYLTYKKKLKNIGINSNIFTKLLSIGKTTPSTHWKTKNEVPKSIEFILDLLEELPEENRVLFLHRKLKEEKELIL
jgi:hypothetical protein